MSMTHVENYSNKQTGATRQTRRLPALRPHLTQMMDKVDNPHNGEDRKTVKEQFLQFMNSAAGAQFRETAYIYWFDNNYRSLLADYPETENGIAKRTKNKAQAQALKEQIAGDLIKRVDQTIEKKVQIILLDWTLPNGKALRDCTGRDCKQMSSKVGDWLSKIADRVKPTQRVGTVLREADVRKLFPGMPKE